MDKLEMQELYIDIKQKAEELVNAPSCCQELKEKGKEFIDSIGTGKEKEAAKALFDEIEDDVMPVDALVAFFSTKEAAEKFGAETAEKISAHAKELKESGAKYCDCAACTAAAKLLDIKDRIFAKL